jgi:hypothetical protein
MSCNKTLAWCESRWASATCGPASGHGDTFLNKGKRGGEKTMAEAAYCVKCKQKREMKESQQITMKNGKPAMQGPCVECGTKLTRIMAAQK